MKSKDAKTVYCIATLDTKGPDAEFVTHLIRGWGHHVVLLDVGTQSLPTVKPDQGRETLLNPAQITNLSRAEAIDQMSAALKAFLKSESAAGKLAGVIGMGGTGGTALICPTLRALPIGLPKVMISTVASGDTRPYVGTSDIFMVYPVVDVAGLNQVSKTVYAQAAGALAGMIEHQSIVELKNKKTVGITMFGVTTPCVTKLRELLELEGWEVFTFHATGSGGRAMESLVASGLLSGVIDLTTTEVADEIAGGIFPAGPDRMDVILKMGIPYVISAGAMDMVNFGAIDSIPPKYQNRNLYKHNSQITLMRTTPMENTLAGEWIAKKLAIAKGPWRVILPEGGVSSLDAPGKPFEDKEADEAFFQALERGLEQTPNQVIRDPQHINENGFAHAVKDLFLGLVEMKTKEIF
jgi:uncharacterized protein (UPF0261 family)